MSKLKRKIRELERLKIEQIKAEKAYEKAQPLASAAAARGQYSTFHHPDIEYSSTIDDMVEELEKEVIKLEKKEEKSEHEREVEQEKTKIEETEKQRDHELQMALIHRDTVIAQAEVVRLAAKTTAKAQEQANASLDGLIKGMKDDG